MGYVAGLFLSMAGAPVPEAMKLRGLADKDAASAGLTEYSATAGRLGVLAHALYSPRSRPALIGGAMFGVAGLALSASYLGLTLWHRSLDLGIRAWKFSRVGIFMWEFPKIHLESFSVGIFN